MYAMSQGGNMEILLRKKGTRKWEKVGEQKFTNEAVLQDILYKSPEIIPLEKLGGNIKEPKVFVKEAGLAGSGSADLIGIDESGGITIIECKLATNADIRRKVIGQLLEYAAYLWQKTFEEFDEICSRAEKWGNKHLLDILREKMGVIGEPWSDEEFRQKISQTLTNGDFRLIIAVDTLSDELRRIVEFVNSRGENAATIHVLEMRQYETPELQMLVPELFGSRPTPTDTPRGRQWDEPSFFQQMATQRSDDETEVVRELLKWAKSNMSRIWWGKGAKYGSFAPVLDRNGNSYTVIAVYVGFTRGYVEMQFCKMQTKPPFNDVAKRVELLRRLNEVEGVSLPEDSINKYPSVYLSTLTNKRSLRQFIDVLNWFVQEVKST